MGYLCWSNWSSHENLTSSNLLVLADQCASTFPRHFEESGRTHLCFLSCYNLLFRRRRMPRSTGGQKLIIFARHERAARRALRTAGFPHTSNPMTLRAYVMFLVSCNSRLCLWHFANLNRWVWEVIIEAILCLSYQGLPYDLRAKWAFIEMAHLLGCLCLKQKCGGGSGGILSKWTSEYPTYWVQNRLWTSFLAMPRCL